MKLFHQLEETDQHNSISWCMGEVVDDFLEDGVEIEAHSDEDKKSKIILEKAVADAKLLPEEKRFDFLAEHKEAGEYIFDLALDLARGSYYCSADDNVVFYEDLRMEEDGEATEITDIVENDGDTESIIEPINTTSSKNPKHSIN